MEYIHIGIIRIADREIPKLLQKHLGNQRYDWDITGYWVNKNDYYCDVTIYCYGYTINAPSFFVWKSVDHGLFRCDIRVDIDTLYVTSQDPAAEKCTRLCHDTDEMCPCDSIFKGKMPRGRSLCAFEGKDCNQVSPFDWKEFFESHSELIKFV